MKKLIPIFLSLFVCIFSIVPFGVQALSDEQEEDMYKTVIEIWNYVNNNVQSASDANAKNDAATQKMDEVKKTVEENNPEDAIKGYFDTIQDDETEEPTAAVVDDIDETYKLPTKGTPKKTLAGPRAIAYIADFTLECVMAMIKYADPASSQYIDGNTNGELSKQLGVYSINLSAIEDSRSTLGKIVVPLKLFAYSLVLLFFAVNLVEQTIKYEIFTAKCALKVFGRLLLAKIIIDLSVRVCLLIISIIGSITVQMLDTVDVSLNIFPDISLGKSDVKIIGPILDAIVAFVVSIVLILIIGVVLVCVSIVTIKLVLRSIELAVLMVISPAFFACLSTDVTKEYFKKFISVFIQVAAQTLFMAIALAVCCGHFNTPPVEIKNLSGLAVGIIKIAPNIVMVIAMCVMMVKPPKVLTNLVK